MTHGAVVLTVTQAADAVLACRIPEKEMRRAFRRVAIEALPVPCLGICAQTAKNILRKGRDVRPEVLQACGVMLDALLAGRWKPSMGALMDAFDRELANAALRECGDNRNAAAHLLKITRGAFLAMRRRGARADVNKESGSGLKAQARAGAA